MKTMKTAKAREVAARAAGGGGADRAGSAFSVKTYNAISPEGLAKFPGEIYETSGADDFAEPHAIMLRSHKLQEDEVPDTVRAIARCGAGVNNIPVDRMTALGVPVFNTPGANANAVKELALCGLFLASRGVMEGATRMEELHQTGEAHAQIEKVKAQFGGRELAGKTLGVDAGPLGHSIMAKRRGDRSSNLASTIDSTCR